MALFDASVPADGEAVKLGAQRIRETKGILQTLLSIIFNNDFSFKLNFLPGAALVDASVIAAKLDTTTVAPIYQVPTGALMDFAGSTAPTNYLLCFGHAVSRTT